jgi:hypothetical protein
MHEERMDSELEWIDEETILCGDECAGAAWLHSDKGMYELDFFVDSDIQSEICMQMEEVV